MPTYGFLIDQRKCIGCHACSVACKSENEVPLGVYRTWVKYVETGSFPNTRRHFQVTRCNHCANPPCVRICPVTAMYQREDGIVEFDPKVCIGCKACLQACPYDAIYIDPETHSAAKCHYCAHRTDLGLEPACVIVCPTRAIVSGDLDDPAGEISRLVARHPVSVRKPEQGTAPKLFYIDADEATLTPTAPEMRETFFWADVVTDHAESWAQQTARRDELAAGRRQGLGTRQGPLTIGGRVSEHLVQTAYSAQHKTPWHWPVPAYLVTKAIGSGAAILAALAVILGWTRAPEAASATFLVGAMVVALLFTAITTALLVFDLEKPAMFLTILTRPQWRSWLTRGAFLLIGFSAVAALWLLVEAGLLLGLLPLGVAAVMRVLLAWLTFPLALGAAIYTAFLFAQAEGRDLWQSPLLPLHLAIQALVAGAAVLLVLAIIVPVPDEVSSALVWIFGASLLVDLGVILFGEFGVAHASEVAARAAHTISHGRYSTTFWGGAIVGGHLIPFVLLAAAVWAGASLGGLLLAAAAAVTAVAGLYAFEYAFVMAPQEIPNS